MNYVFAIVLRAEDVSMNKTEKVPVLIELML